MEYFIYIYICVYIGSTHVSVHKQGTHRYHCSGDFCTRYKTTALHRQLHPLTGLNLSQTGEMNDVPAALNLNIGGQHKTVQNFLVLIALWFAYVESDISTAVCTKILLRNSWFTTQRFFSQNFSQIFSNGPVYFARARNHEIHLLHISNKGEDWGQIFPVLSVSLREKITYGRNSAARRLN